MKSRKLLLATSAAVALALPQAAAEPQKDVAAPPKPARAACNYPPTSRYVIKGAEVYDTETQLTWQRCSVGQRWQEGKGCMGVVRQLTWSETWSHERDGWRVPTQAQFVTLISPACKIPAINEEAFPDMELNKLVYWAGPESGLTLPSSVSFEHGLSGPGKFIGARAGLALRLVRDGE